MCGLFGIAAGVGLSPSLDDAAVCRARDRMARRGPDGAGLWRRRNVVLAHRRLAVIDPSSAGAQPMLLAGRRADPGSWLARPHGPHVTDGGPALFALVYNGELYNDAELRRELSARGVQFRSGSDTETVIMALAFWGLEALRRLRGMFALAMYDCQLDTLTLARDPLGIKPLYYAENGREIVFASEARIVADALGRPVRPDPFMLSAYLTTIRTVLGDRTMYDGVRAVRAGETVTCDLGGGGVCLRVLGAPQPAGETSESLAESLQGPWASGVVGAAVEDSVARHLRADVPTCCLLSGGLDSTIVASIARGRHAELRTYAAGAPVPSECSDTSTTGDLRFARLAARHLGTRHSEAHVTRELFGERWPWMVRELGVPLSTPNEVAIWVVASRLREDGCVVTISGEGADELFAGYESPMRAAFGCAARISAGERASPGLVELNDSAWTPLSAKTAVLNDRVHADAGSDEPLVKWYEQEFDRAVGETPGGYGPAAHLRFHQRVNLVGLLQRLDTATMLAGVEGRTPLADKEILRIATLLPMEVKCAAEAYAGIGAPGNAPQDDGSPPPLRTKIALREAFEGRIPHEIVERPKASFPLPFQGWLGDQAQRLRASAFAREVFTDAAVELVASRPQELWRLAWPMMNLTMWGDAL